jgi:uncharacterized protein (DUF952 family)
MKLNSDNIFHVISLEDWDKVKEKDFYTPMSLTNEGFIHFSFEDQIPGVIERFYNNQKNLLILKIDRNKLKSKLKLESVPGFGDFPHLFGELNLDAVVEIYESKSFITNKIIGQLKK